MAATVETCQWESPLDGAFCSIPLDGTNSSFCILHAPNPDKDRDGKFSRVLEEKIKADEETECVDWIDLSGVIFPSDVNFAKTFSKDISFDHALFSGRAGFNNNRFRGRASFRETQFSVTAEFHGAKFRREADFQASYFNVGAYFFNAQFSNQVFFLDARFIGPAYFSGAHFGGEAQFSSSQFNGDADFSNVELISEAVFVSATFNGSAFFDDSTFHRTSTFSRTNFTKVSSFVNATFCGDASFDGAPFAWRADFSKAKFSKNTDFSSSVVNESLSFQGPTFPDSASDSVVHFNAMTADSAQQLCFEGVVLSRVSFLRTDVSEINFIDCTWAERPSTWFPFLPGRKSRPPRKAVYDEVAAFERKKNWENINRDIPLIADIYRQLRRNLESKRQEAEAGDFYIGQMEMRLDDPSESWLIHGMLRIYRFLAMYGESLGRPLVAYFLAAFGFALLYLWGGFQAGETPVRYSLGFDPGNLVAFGKDFVRAYVQALTAGGILGANLAGLAGASLEGGSWWVPLARYANMLLDTFLVGFFVIALRRHFRR